MIDFLEVSLIAVYIYTGQISIEVEAVSLGTIRIGNRTYMFLVLVQYFAG